MKEDIKPQDHPDFIGGWVWTKLEMRWIEDRIAKAIEEEREACAKLCEPQEEHDDPLTAWKIAAAIRARGKP